MLLKRGLTEWHPQKALFNGILNDTHTHKITNILCYTTCKIIMWK